MKYGAADLRNVLERGVGLGRRADARVALAGDDDGRRVRTAVIVGRARGEGGSGGKQDVCGEQMMAPNAMVGAG